MIFFEKLKNLFVFFGNQHKIYYLFLLKINPLSLFYFQGEKYGKCFFKINFKTPFFL